MTRQAIMGVRAKRSYRVAGVPDTSRGDSVPAPVEGWDAITPLAAMPPTRAVTMVNVFPQPGYVEIKKGHKRHNLVTGAVAIESLMEYHAQDPDNDALFAAGGTSIWDVTASTSATVSTTAVGGLSGARFQHINFSTSGDNFLWACNGADAPRMYNGAWATASVVGITVPADIINVASYKNRIWLAVTGKMSPYYLNTDSVQGTATPFSLAGVFNKGGFLQAIGTWSTDGDAGSDNRIAFLTSEGECAVYDGTDPATNFTLKGVYSIGSPIGRRCLTKVGADLAVVSIDGVLPLSRALITDRAAIITQSLTKLIQPVMNQSARDYGANFGWQLIGYPRGTRAILNVPIDEGVTQEQYIMNTVTGAWCKFDDEDANCWVVFQDRLFYGGNSGEVVEADCQGYNHDSDIEFELETAFNYFGSRGRLKQFTMARALLTTDGNVRPGLGINVDFSRNSEVGATSFETAAAALWDVANWDEGVWPEVVRIVTDWVSISGMGYCAGIRMTGTVAPGEGVEESQSVTLQVNGFDVQMIDGGAL